MYKALSFALLLGPAALLSCQHDKHHCDPAPTPQCYPGVVIGHTCMDGTLIAVDARYPIGRPAVNQENVLLGTNVIAVANSSEVGPLLPDGQTVYFNYVNDPNRQRDEWTCFAYDAIKSPIPHLVLSNVSATGCLSAPH
jgi:hypothetical protein